MLKSCNRQGSLAKPDVEGDSGSRNILNIAKETNTPAGAEDRAYLVGVMTRVSGPVLEALSENKLKETFPIRDWDKHRQDCTYTEAFARTLAGVAPWVELGPDSTKEGKLREKFGLMARRSLINATDPKSPDFLSFGQSSTVDRQALVEAAYMAQALLRAPRVLWEPLTESQMQNVIASLKTSRSLKPNENNWLLFASMVEAAIWHFTGDLQKSRLKYGLDKFRQWYRGDGTHGDGPQFHWDYYNGYVIHPMLMDILKVCREKSDRLSLMYDKELLRAQRYAAIQERLISPEATFPVIGRSSAYRFAAFQALSQIILLEQLPEAIKPGAARSGITAVVRRMIEAPGTFDKDGWLEIGSVGHQPSIRDSYNATGSLYICLTGLIHLGLPANNPFWLAPSADWTQKKIWSGQDIPADHALEDEDWMIAKRLKDCFKRILINILEGLENWKLAGQIQEHGNRGRKIFAGSEAISALNPVARSGAGPGNANGMPGTSARVPLEQLPGLRRAGENEIVLQQ
jgi:hypothetical protein